MGFFFFALTGFAQQSVEQTFGENFSEKNKISADDLNRKMKSQKEFTGDVTGQVADVCQAKGCWMKLQTSGGAIMVRFKDYGFFVPKDISGKEVVLHGSATLEKISVETLRHYAKDEGKTAEEIAQISVPENQVVFTASGVKILEN